MLPLLLIQTYFYNVVGYVAANYVGSTSPKIFQQTSILLVFLV